MILILYFVALVVIVYFLLIRPQKKRKKAHQQMLDALTLNCEVVTIGGLHGNVSALGADTINIVIKGGSEAEFDKGAIAKIVEVKTV